MRIPSDKVITQRERNFLVSQKAIFGREDHSLDIITLVFWDNFPDRRKENRCDLEHDL